MCMYVLACAVDEGGSWIMQRKAGKPGAYATSDKAVQCDWTLMEE